MAMSNETVSAAPSVSGKCINCGQPFVLGVNVFTDDGIRETAITQTCEECFDSYFDDPEQDDEPYCVCGETPTEDEEASNKCACCGKAFV